MYEGLICLVLHGTYDMYEGLICLVLHGTYKILRAIVLLLCSNFLQSLKYEGNSISFQL